MMRNNYSYNKVREPGNWQVDMCLTYLCLNKIEVIRGLKRFMHHLPFQINIHNKIFIIFISIKFLKSNICFNFKIIFLFYIKNKIYNCSNFKTIYLQYFLNLIFIDCYSNLKCLYLGLFYYHYSIYVQYSKSMNCII